MINEQNAPPSWLNDPSVTKNKNKTTVTPTPSAGVRKNGATPAQELSTEFPDDGLRYGMTKNAYVRQLQKTAFNLAPNLQTGNYLDVTKAAVAKFIADNNITDVAQDGSNVTYHLYLRLLNVDENGDPYDYSQNKTTQPVTDNTPADQKAATTQNNSGSFNKSQIKFPIYLGQGNPDEGYDPATWGRYITALQRAVGVATSGVIDQATIDGIKRFINDPKKKALFTEPLDTDSMNVLENGSKPGITSLLYNTIVRTNDLIILQNRKASRPEEVINEMSRVKLKLRRFFKK